MDRFKFRVWDKENKMWFKDFVIDNEGNFLQYNYRFNECDGDLLYPYDNYIIQQCTGLKDKNGKLIYEGDILYINSIPKEVIFLPTNSAFVYKEIKNSLPDFTLMGNKFSLIDIPDNEKYEIIGNILEHPKLLEK